MKVLLSCPINTQTGYGQDGVELARALMQWGVDVYVHPSGVHPPLPADVAALLTKRIPEHVDLHLAHRCPQELAQSPESAGFYATSTVAVAWSMWEWDTIVNVDEINQSNCEHAFKVGEALPEALSRFDALLVYDKVSHNALSPFHKRVDILQGGVTPLAPAPRDWQASPFRFLMVGALSTRKNPFAAIRAFKKLRDAGELADATLTLKTTFPGLHPSMEQWCPGLKIIGDVWPTEQLHQLYRDSHVLLAPSWGEGKNRPAIEFATSGGAVAATCIGGHEQWMAPEYTFPLRFELKEQYPGARGASVDVDHLAETMLALYTDRAETARRAEIASRVLPSMVTWPRVLERLQEWLRTVAGARGEEVSVLMRACRRPEPALSPAAREQAARGALDGVSVA